MTTIDIENSKQIRQPMDVIIQIAAAETATLTYSGYSAAKVADGELGEPDWPMRKLADLQGDGFLLDGSAVLYDSTVTASAANGKLGVRSVIGTAISVTVTSDVALQYLTVTASGAESVTYNGTAYSMTSGYALIPVGGGTTFTLTFTPAAADERVEISDIQPGALIKITNDNLISAVVSLRSDLSILEPTLPESEINIEAYFDDDISEALTAIPDETPITYQAGYPGDMSPVRNFYLAEQITWADNVMSIHGVDAVHKLDKTTEPVSIGDTDCVISVAEYGTSIYDIMVLFYYYAMNAGVDIASYESIPQGWRNPYWTPVSKVNKGIRQKRALLGRGHTYRDVLAELMNCFHFSDIDPQFIETYSARWENFWPTYVDAGIPALTVSKPTTKWDIYENDCGNVERKTGRKIQSIKATLHDVNSAAITQSVTRELNYALNSKVGSFDWEKNGGGVLNLDSDYIFALVIGVESSEIGGSSLKISPMVPIDSYGWPAIDTDEISFKINDRSYDFRGHYLIDSQTLYGTVPGNHAGEYVYTQSIPWDCTYGSVYQDGFSYKWKGSSNVWAGLVNAGVISSDTTQATLDVYGFSMAESLYEQTYQSGEQGGSDESIEFLLHGHVWMTNECGFDDSEIEPTVIVELFPQKAVESLLSRSSITGSFTWKGDPRMQPRDVATFHRLDGTTEEITLESITITHEGGGTSAEITYRKGVC